jgi:hypothetical protein
MRPVIVLLVILASTTVTAVFAALVASGSADERVSAAEWRARRRVAAADAQIRLALDRRDAAYRRERETRDRTERLLGEAVPFAGGRDHLTQSRRYQIVLSDEIVRRALVAGYDDTRELLGKYVAGKVASDIIEDGAR